jgi:hypothetical protein
MRSWLRGSAAGRAEISHREILNQYSNRPFVFYMHKSGGTAADGWLAENRDARVGMREEWFVARGVG